VQNTGNRHEHRSFGTCEDCGQKSEVALHWGFFVPENSNLWSCDPCWSKRRQYFAIRLRPKPLGRFRAKQPANGVVSEF